LNDGACPASRIHNLQFAIFDDAVSGVQQGNAITNAATSMSSGLFTVTLDFGNQLPGADRWLEIGVRTNGGGAFATPSRGDSVELGITRAPRVLADAPSASGAAMLNEPFGSIVRIAKCSTRGASNCARGGRGPHFN
jgi:hypothetical protein